MSAADWFRKMREILAGPGQSAEFVAYRSWWQSLQTHERRAFLVLAGVRDAVPKNEWGDLPRIYRAAIVNAAENMRQSLAGIASVSEQAQSRAVALLEREARRLAA